MGSETKDKAVKKLGNMKRLIAYPDELLVDNILDNYHKNLIIDPKSYYVSRLRINKFSTDREIKLKYDPASEIKWTREFGEAATVDNFYDTFHNSISLY